MYRKLEGDLLDAVKRKDKFTVNILRYLKSNLDSSAKDKLSDLDDTEVIKVLRMRLKQSLDAEGKFRQGGREDLVAQEQEERKMVSGYLPPQMSEEELGGLVKKAIEETGAKSSADFGRVMKKVMEAAAGRADGQSVKTAVESLLGKKN